LQLALSKIALFYFIWVLNVCYYVLLDINVKAVDKGNKTRGEQIFFNLKIAGCLPESSSL